MNKKIVIISILSIIIVNSLLLLSTGGKMAGIFLDDYSLFEDGSVMTLKTGVASSMGYIRSVKERQDENKLYLTFYSTYGLNSKFGANNEFQIELHSTINEIYFYRGDAGYDLILQKNETTNEWFRFISYEMRTTAKFMSEGFCVIKKEDELEDNKEALQNVESFFHNQVGVFTNSNFAKGNRIVVLTLLIFTYRKFS